MWQGTPRDWDATEHNGRPLWVYFAGADGTPIKIGISINPDRRLKRIFCPETGRSVEILARVRGCYGDERALHDSFAEECVWGEWFRRTPRVLAARLRGRRGACPASCVAARAAHGVPVGPSSVQRAEILDAA